MSLKYELFATKYHFETTNHITWHWSIVPEDELFKAGWIHDFNKWRIMKKEKNKKDKKIQEYGLDGLSKDSDGNYYGLQEKYYLSRSLNGNDLGSFYQSIYMRLKQNNPKNSGFVYYPNKLEINLRDDIKNTNSKDQAAIKFIKLQFIESNIKQENIDCSTFKLYDFQQEALDNLLQDWKKQGLLNMPCSCGKTIILGNYLKIKQFKIIIILSPTRVLTKQNFERIKLFLNNYNHLLVDSDMNGTRNIDEIIEVLEKDKKVFISSTYKSIDILYEIFNEYYDDIFICIDECHNINEEVDEFINNFKQSLLISATPSNILDIPIIHKMKFEEAINKKLITDYEVYIPLFNDKISNLEIEIKDLNKNYILQAEFLSSGMLRTGSRRCISYHQTKEDAYNFNKTIKKIFEEYHNELFIGYLIVDTINQNKREEILNEFNDIQLLGNHFSVISSVRILDEGIDIPLCDSVFFADPNENLTDSSKRRIIQRLNRATRKHNEFSNKIAKCFMYCNELNQLCDLFQILKENDINFSKKVKYISPNYDENGKEYLNKEEKHSKLLENYVLNIQKWSDNWNNKYQLLQEFVEKYNKLPISKEYYNGYNLGIWCRYNQIRYSNNLLQEEKIKKLENIKNWKWIIIKKKINSWDDIFEIFKCYLNEYNNKMPKYYEKYKEINIRYWVDSQKRRNITKTIRPEEKEKLESIQGWKWRIIQRNKPKSWDEHYNSLLTYIENNNKFPNEKINYIGKWLQKQREKYKNKLLDVELQNKLELIPNWNWSPIQNKWNTQYESLIKYINENNKLPVKNYWIERQRSDYRKNKLSDERIKKLENIKLWKW